MVKVFHGAKGQRLRSGEAPAHPFLLTATGIGLLTINFLRSCEGPQKSKIYTHKSGPGENRRTHAPGQARS